MWLSLLDTAFDYKKQLAFQQQTKFIVYSELNTDLSLSEELLIDLSIILASCLDNALEATLKIPQKDNRWIKIFLENVPIIFTFKLKIQVHQTITINDSQIPINNKRKSFDTWLRITKCKKFNKQTLWQNYF